MKKRFVSFLMSLVMVISLICVVPAITASAATSGDYEYSILKDNTIEITGYNGSGTDLTIPSTIDGKKITSIGAFAFRSCNSLKSVTIPDTVKNIYPLAFYYCENLSEVTIPNSVTYIGVGSFNGCNKLSDVYYAGSEEEWSEIYHWVIGRDSLANATIHYNYVPVSKPEIKYQLAKNIEGMIRFVLLVDEEKAQNTQVANISLNGNGINNVNVPITTAYRSIKADGDIISAGEGKVFLIVMFRNFPTDKLNGLNVKINLDDEIYERTILC